ncbi:hypothetical protein ACFSC4_20115 [Deinococcus malanensis]|uniref:hypothetical protein n=1 Tax=Deinococcus malanensis TaxID=1706855 RepID=UPI003637C2B1
MILRDITDRQWLLRKEAERGYLRNLFNDAPIALSILRGPQHQFEFINDFARQLIGNRNVDGLTVREAFPELEQQGFFELLDQVYRTGVAVEGTERRAQLTDPHTGAVRDLYINYAYVPLRGSTPKCLES